MKKERCDQCLCKRPVTSFRRCLRCGAFACQGCLGLDDAGRCHKCRGTFGTGIDRESVQVYTTDEAVKMLAAKPHSDVILIVTTTPEAAHNLADWLTGKLSLQERARVAVLCHPGLGRPRS